MLPVGFPAYLCWFAAKDSVEMQGGWDVMGLRGTGSFDYTIPEQLIEAGRTFFLFDTHLVGLDEQVVVGTHIGDGGPGFRRGLQEQIVRGRRVRKGRGFLTDIEIQDGFVGGSLGGRGRGGQASAAADGPALRYIASAALVLRSLR